MKRQFEITIDLANDYKTTKAVSLTFEGDAVMSGPRATEILRGLFETLITSLSDTEIEKLVNKEEKKEDD